MKFKPEVLNKLYKKIEELERSYLILSKAHYHLISSLVPEVKPTKKELKAIEKKEKLIPLSKIK